MRPAHACGGCEETNQTVKTAACILPISPLFGQVETGFFHVIPLFLWSCGKKGGGVGSIEQRGWLGGTERNRRAVGGCGALYSFL